MSEERLQEIKDSIELQYKVQEANDLHSFNIFTDEEQELVEEVERLHSIIKEAIEYIEKHKETREHYEPFGTPMGNPNYITTHILGYYELLEILGRAEEE